MVSVCVSKNLAVLSNEAFESVTDLEKPVAPSIMTFSTFLALSASLSPITSTPSLVLLTN